MAPLDRIYFSDEDSASANLCKKQDAKHILKGKSTFGGIDPTTSKIFLDTKSPDWINTSQSIKLAIIEDLNVSCKIETNTTLNQLRATIGHNNTPSSSIDTMPNALEIIASVRSVVNLPNNPTLSEL